MVVEAPRRLALAMTKRCAAGRWAAILGRQGITAYLNLAPSQHAEEPIKRILGGVMSVVNGLGTLRNRLSDSHGRGKKLQVRPSQRHANLAVNAAGAVATFLVETHRERNG